MISAVTRRSVFKKRRREIVSSVTMPGEVEKEEEDQIIRRKVFKRVSRMKFVNGIEHDFLMECVGNEEKLTKFVHIQYHFYN